MRGEIHLINLIKTSSQVREVVSKLLGSSRKPWETEERLDLLLRLPLKQTLSTLADRLECSRDQVFTKIVDRARPSTAGSYPLKLMLEHLREMDSVDTHSRLARILNCDPWDVLDELFDVQAILNTLFQFAPEMVRQILRPRISKDRLLPAAGEAIRSILLVHRRLEEHFGIEESDWGQLIDNQNWLRQTAVTRIVRFCSERGIVQPSASGFLVAALHESSHNWSSDGEDVPLDALAIIHIQQRISWIVQQLREQAYEVAQNIAARLPGSPLSRFQQHLEFYELKAPACAWRSLFTKRANAPAMSETFPGVDIRSTGTAGTPLKASVFKTRTEQTRGKLPFWKFMKRRVVETNLIVSCQIAEAVAPVDILICRNVSPAQFASLEEFFSAIPAVSASQNWVSDIGKKLLLAPRIFSQSFVDILVNACDSFSRELIQELILTGVRPKSGLESKLPQQLSSDLLIRPVEAQRDVIHPLNRSDIMELIQKDQGDQSNVLVIT